jgi:radical SAM superfamily enzyme YgiQ (UPF0313 family)
MILINPSIIRESQNPVIAPFIYKMFPTSLGFLAGYLREYNRVIPQIIDEDVTSLDRDSLAGLLKKDSGPKIVGMSVVTINSKRAYRLAKIIKDIDRSYLIILGGIHPTVLPDEALNHPEIDIVVQGEGENTLSELIARLEKGTDYTDIEGIAYKKEGKIVHNPRRPLIDLSLMPPFPYDLFDTTYGSYRDFGSVFTSRGCPYNCIFCSQRAISGQKVRYIAPGRILNDIELLVNKYHQEKILFMDDNFAVNKGHTLGILNGIIDRGLHKKVCFVAEMRGDAVDYEMLKKMKEANVNMVSIGMETGSQRLLGIIDKKEKVEDNVRAIRLAHQLGMTTSTSFIFGLPTEQRQERLLTARLAREIPLDDARFNVAVPYPGTRLFALAKEEKRLQINPDWSNFNVQFYMFGSDIPYVPREVNRYQLIFDTFMANLRFYLRWKILIKTFSSPVAGGMVLSWPKHWYLSLREIWRFLRLIMFVFSRFLAISFLYFRERVNWKKINWKVSLIMCHLIVRRHFYLRFRKNYVLDSLARRKGKCRHCTCCNIDFFGSRYRCGHYDETKSLRRCKVYQTGKMPRTCFYSFFDEQDKWPQIKDKCGYYWDD